MTELPHALHGPKHNGKLPIDWTPQLIALDIDDTLTHHMGTVDERVMRSIERVQEAGIKVALATGRSFSTTYPVARSAGIDDLVVCSNGAILASVETVKIIEAVTFDPSPLIAPLLEMIPDAIFAVEDIHGEFTTTHLFDTGALGLSIREAELSEMTNDPCVRLVVRSHDHAERGFREVADHLGFHSVIFGIAEVAWMDIGPKGVNKSTMLTELCARRDVDPARVIAIGDSWNDTDMLNWAGLGVAMDSAPDGVKAFANLTTQGIPGEGVADVLDAIAI
jgi:5-amino-6-(5-phospho-D-ribitylamino)uracil phosphatase